MTEDEAKQIKENVHSAILFDRNTLHYAVNPKTGKSEAVLRSAPNFTGTLVNSLGFKADDIHRIVGGPYGNHYEVFFNDSELNQAVLAEFKKQEESKALQMIEANNKYHTCDSPYEKFDLRFSKIEFTLSEYKILQNKGLDLLYIAMTDEDARKEITENGAEHFRNVYRAECEGVSAVIDKDKKLQKELVLSKKIYDMQAKYGTTELKLNKDASMPLYSTDVYLTNYKTNNTCNHPKLGINDTIFQSYRHIGMLLDTALKQDPSLPDLRFGISFDKNHSDKLKLVLLEPHHTYKDPHYGFSQTFYQEFKYGNHPDDLDKYKKALDMLTQAATKAGFAPVGTGSSHMPVIMLRTPVGYMPYNQFAPGKNGVLCESEVGFSLIVKNHSKAYKNLSVAVEETFPLYIPCNKDGNKLAKNSSFNKLSAFKDNITLKLYKIKNNGRESR